MNAILPYHPASRNLLAATRLALISNILGGIVLAMPPAWNAASILIARFNTRPNSAMWPQPYILSGMLLPLFAMMFLCACGIGLSLAASFKGARFVSSAFGFFANAVALAIAIPLAMH